MKSILKYTIKYIAFWYLFFTIQKFLFLILNKNFLYQISFFEIIQVFYYSISLDISAISYVFIIPLILITLSCFIRNKKLTFKILVWYSYILIILNCLITSTDIGLFGVWNSKINSKFLSYLLFPSQAINTIEGTFFIWLIFLFVFQSLIFCYINKKLFDNNIPLFSKRIIFSILYFLIFSFGIFVGIRGGLQDFPINRSWVYYSKHNILNNASVNSFWNVLDVIFNREIKENPYKYFNEQEAKAIIDELFQNNNKTNHQVINNHRPNIILILLESWSANAIGSLNGAKGITNGFDSLTKEGILFTNFYSSGFRTEQGLISLLSAFPAQPKTTIMRKFGKFEFLPNLNRVLLKNGYFTSYYYTGDIEFANTESYLKVSGFDYYLSEKTFKANRRTRWGAYDEELFNFQLKDILKRNQPFFSIIMTSTSHELFTADVTKKINKNDEASRYLNTIAYTDSCLFDYIKKAKKEPWYKNTIFIITADHGHYNPINCNYNSPERHHIPMLWLGGALKDEYKNTINSKTTYHVDVAKTLLKQLNIEDSCFVWSKNIFNEDSLQFAFYTFDNGFGMIRENNFVVFDQNLNKTISSKGDEKQKAILTRQGKAFLQLIFQKYLDFNN